MYVYLRAKDFCHQVQLIVGQVENERRISVLCMLNHRYYLLKFQRPLFCNLEKIYSYIHYSLQN
jgi:hypothetical protein